MKNYQNQVINFCGNSGLVPSVVEVESSIPAFIGYTSKATRKVADDLIMVPTKINSIREFESLFGFPYAHEIEVTTVTDSSKGFAIADFKESELKYMLYYSLRLYFENGGGTCYIVSVDTYRNARPIALRRTYWMKRFGLLDGLDQIADVNAISMVVIPEAVRLSAPDYSILIKAVLLQCHLLGNRFAIFDLWTGENGMLNINFSKSLFGNKYLCNAAAYYPYLTTSMSSYINPEESNVKVSHDGVTTMLGEMKGQNFLLYKWIKNELKNHCLQLPACGAVAGIFVSTDQTRGVWKSPANCILSGVINPAQPIGHQLSAEMNLDQDTWKTVNLIHLVPGKGSMITGARTLEGSDEQGIYIAVRRLMIMIRESLRISTSWVAYEPININTCLKARIMIEKYLTLKW